MINPINRRISAALFARCVRHPVSSSANLSRRHIDPIPYPVREELTVNERLITSGERCRGPAEFMTRSCCVRAGVLCIHACESSWERDEMNGANWTELSSPASDRVYRREKAETDAMRYETSSRSNTRCRRESIFDPLNQFLITEIKLLREIGSKRHEAQHEPAYGFTNDQFWFDY